MREILFRAKRQDNGEWIEGFLSYGNIIKTVRKCYDWRGDYICDSLEEYKVDKETVGQFTGLKDKNGKKIFEGDIVEATYGCELMDISEVKRNLVVSYGRFGYGSQIGFMRDFPLPGCLKVIGNIHDNPELLKELQG